MMLWFASDSRTGLTLWKTAFESKGFNHHGSGKNYGGHYTPCVKDGRVYVPGSMGRAYCLDALTGEVIWDVSLGPIHDAWAYHKARHMAKKTHLTGINFEECMGNRRPEDARAEALFSTGNERSR